MARTAIVVCAGGPARAALPDVPDDALVIAADAGILEAERLGLHVDLLIGDLDSAPADAVARAARVERHPVDKDASDLELAVAGAVAADVRRIVVVGGDGGRLDHLLGNAFLLASDRWAGVQIDAVLGELVSLYAVGGPATGVTTEGLRWALTDGELRPGSSLGLSNEFVAPVATVRVRDGAIVAIRPGIDA